MTRPSAPDDPTPPSPRPAALSARHQALAWGIAAAVFAWALWAMGHVLLPFVVAAAVAYVLNPAVQRLVGLGLPRVLAVALVLLTLALAVAGAVVSLAPLLVEQGRQLAATLPDIIARVQDAAAGWLPALPDGGEGWRALLAETGARLREHGGDLAAFLAGSVRGIAGVVLFLLIVPVASFYLMLDWDRMLARIDSLLPTDHAPVVRDLARQVDSALAGFLRGQATVIVILAVYYATALTLVGLPFGVVVGVVTGAISFIPYVGAIIGGALSLGLAAYAFWGDPVWIVAVLVIFVAGQALEGNVLVPKLVGDHIGVHPVWLLLALSVFGSLFGFVGMLVAVPVSAVLGVLVRFAVARYRASALFRGSGEGTA